MAKFFYTIWGLLCRLLWIQMHHLHVVVGAPLLPSKHPSVWNKKCRSRTQSLTRPLQIRDPGVHLDLVMKQFPTQLPEFQQCQSNPHTSSPQLSWYWWTVCHRAGNIYPLKFVSDKTLFEHQAICNFKNCVDLAFGLCLRNKRISLLLSLVLGYRSEVYWVQRVQRNNVRNYQATSLLARTLDHLASSCGVNLLVKSY
jgi:hypothetical protein